MCIFTIIFKLFSFLIFGSSKSVKISSLSPYFSTSNKAQVQVYTGLSNKGMKSLASILDHVLDQRVVEKNFHAKFVAFCQQLSEDFVISTVSTSTDQGSLAKTVVNCLSLKDFLQKVTQHRGTSKDHIVKLGIYGGGGF